MPPVALALTLLVVMLTLVGAIMVRAYLRQRIDWKTTPRGFLYHALGPMDPARLDAHITLALTCLREHSDFTPQTLQKTAAQTRIIVQRVTSWHSPAHGTSVAGLSTGMTIHVGSDLAALAHELAHECEFTEGGAGAQDFTHATWSARGIQRAVDVYERERTNIA